MKALLQVADLFCGAGGFSTAVLEALGKDRVNLVALNHWDRAIETHNANHPGGERADLYDADPLSFVPGGELDLLVASPTCTFFSRARGGKPVSFDQRKGRMTPTQVLRWCKALKVKKLLVENVPEFMDWGPISRVTGKPRPERKGAYFRQWVRDLEELGFAITHEVVNAADHGDATTRRRFFLMGSSDGIKPCFPKPTHSQTGPWGPRFKRWRAAREVIDWKRRGRSIFDRKKALAPKTLLRIYAGVVRFEWPLVFRVRLAVYMRSLGIAVPDLGTSQRDIFDPAVIVLRNHADARSVEDPLPAVTGRGDAPRARVSAGHAQPFVLNRHGENGGTRAHSVDAPLPTATARGAGYIVAPEGDPFLLSQHFRRDTRSVELPIPSLVAVDRTVLLEPFVFPANQGKERARGLRSVEAPLDTIVAKDMKGLVEPFVFGNRTHNVPKGTDSSPLPTNTTTTGGGLALCEPFMLSQGAGGAPRAVEAPVPTIPTEGAHALVAPYYGASAATTVEEPLGTVTTRDRFALVDILFRMLDPDELARAMGFPRRYKFRGNKTERTRMVGNAVAVNTARALVRALMGEAA